MAEKAWSDEGCASEGPYRRPILFRESKRGIHDNVRLSLFTKFSGFIQLEMSNFNSSPKTIDCHYGFQVALNVDGQKFRNIHVTSAL
jgi:hypothetical protein